jgi:hypothetical protein
MTLNLEEDNPAPHFGNLDRIVQEIDLVREEEALTAKPKKKVGEPKQRRPYGQKAREKAIAALKADITSRLLRREHLVPPTVNETFSGNHLRKAREDRERWLEARRRAEQELGFGPPSLPPNRPVPSANSTPEVVIAPPPSVRARVPATLHAPQPPQQQHIQFSSESGFVFTFGGQRMMLLVDPRNSPAENITRPTVWTRVCEENQGEAQEPKEKRQKTTADEDEDRISPLSHRNEHTPAPPPRGARIATFRGPLAEMAETPPAQNGGVDLVPQVPVEGSPASHETTSPVALNA